MQRLIAEAAKKEARVVLFPECSLTGYFDDDYMKSLTRESLDAAERQIAETCRQHSLFAIVGSPTRDGDKLYDSALVFDDSGKILERYHKLQLAESWPTPGDHLSVFPIDGILCSIIICHDERYPELVRIPVLAGARVVFYLSHESGIKQEKKIEPYRAQIQARAVENSVYIAQANAPAKNDASGSHGQSRIIDPDGTVVLEGSIFDEEILYGTIKINRATGRLATQSVSRGLFGQWYKDAVQRVRIVAP
jgi:predicted amidohydrolase